MRLPSRTQRRALGAAVALLGVLGPAALGSNLTRAGDDESAVTPVERFRAAAPRAAAPPTVDEGDLRNFEHVFHYAFPGGSPTDQGTDIEFYSPVVPRRDGAGAIVLDAAGNQILEQRDFAVVGSYDRGAFVFDITDPENTRFVRLIACNQKQNDVQIKQFGTQWILVLTKDGDGPPCVNPQKGPAGPAGIAVFDVTDPYAVKRLYSFRTTGGAHNFTFHPTKPIGWVSTGDLPGGRNHIPIIDFSNLMNPVLKADIEVEGGPHDISFNVDGTRAYVASENNMRIYDTTDPVAPILLSRSAGPASYVHGTDPTPDGRHVILTDESLVLGGFLPVSGTGVCPGGGITMYDVSGQNERAPVPKGFAVANYRGKSDDHRACTAHVGRISPNSKYYVTGWYQAGVRMFDVSNPASPTDIGHAMMPGTEVWAAKFHKGNYVYTGDLGRGFDVYRWKGADLGLPPVTTPEG